jgi:hypothetical protein
MTESETFFSENAAVEMTKMMSLARLKPSLGSASSLCDNMICPVVAGGEAQQM